MLGEAVAAASLAVQVGLDGRATSATLYATAAGGALAVLSMWWVYFAKPIADPLVSVRVAFVWGYGHYVLFAAAAAVGAGIAVNVDRATHHSDLSRTAAGATRDHPGRGVPARGLVPARATATRPAAARLAPPARRAVVVLVVTFTGQPVLATGLAVAILVAFTVILGARSLDAREV